MSNILLYKTIVYIILTVEPLYTEPSKNQKTREFLFLKCDLAAVAVQN